MSETDLLRAADAKGPARDATTADARDAEVRSSLLTPADKVVVAYLTIIAVLVVVFSYRIEAWFWLCAGHALAIAVVAFIAKWDRAREPGAVGAHAMKRPGPLPAFIHGWYPIALVPLTYKELTYLIPRVHPRDFDAALAALDYRMLGVNPTVWIERFASPLLTEVLQLTYSTYYFLPVILGIVLWRNGWFDKFHFLLFALVLGFYLSYLGYIAVPATGPRFLPSIMEAQTGPLAGLWFFQPVREALDSAEGITRDCFPSGHTELTLLVLYYACKFHRRTFWWLLPFGSGIVVSTAYLRYHYVIDVVAGALLAFAIIVVANPMYNWLNRSRPART